MPFMITVMDNRTQQLAQYIQQQMQQGRNDGVIRNQLQQGGWKEEMIDDAFQLLQAPLVDPQADTSQQLPAYAPTAPPKKRNPLKLILIILVALVLVVGIGIVLVVALSNSSLKKNAAVTQQKDSAAVQKAKGNTDNNRRLNDIAAISVGITDYTNQNLGSAPQRTGTGDKPEMLKICGEACGSGANVTTTLAFYKAADVWIKTYSADLAKPDIKSVFIVPSAVCNEDRSGLATPSSSDGSQQASSRSIALLYSLQSDSNSTEQCDII
jgi:hypothetical protein